MSELIETVTLPVELVNRNDGRGHHWARTNQEKKRLVGILREYWKPQPYPFPVTVTVIRILGRGQKLWDYDSGLRGNYKELQDTLVNLGWFHDDSAKWIKGCPFEQDDTQRQNGPATRLEIYRAE